ncbi:glycosyltransferase family 2 protein [Acinetobacter sp.]|uniref:glycosyltransferase family 2 protein n=1 Tax=Acinetobacter sp. TaxID=472 RepID=UPI0026479BD1|nr:glycosyltransferase family 2 protein [Acinetobacter sp.]MDN5512156.1 glycosyltransferase family 2 protein [Acinetobacter sp.]MDN5524171.1 glycosyltransferase family 2 protein [Acinetobacter sp.]
MSNSNPFLCCVVPAHNEAENLKNFIPALSKMLKQENIRFEIIVIDDGSKDSTIEVLQGLQKDYPLRVLEFSRNFGKEAALYAGLDHVDADLALLIDADFQHPINVIPTMLSLWKEGYEMVYGIRNRETESWLKKLFTHIYYKILNASSTLNIPENAGDFRLLDAKVVHAIRDLPERNLYMKGLYAWVGFKSIGILFTEKERQCGRSSFNFKSLLNLAISGLTAFSDLPLRICIYLGILLGIFSFSYGCWITVQTLFEGAKVPGWATLAAGLAFLGAIQLIFIGILGEYISRIYSEVKARPKYIIAAEHSKNRQAVPETESKS